MYFKMKINETAYKHKLNYGLDYVLNDLSIIVCNNGYYTH